MNAPAQQRTHRTIRIAPRETDAPIDDGDTAPYAVAVGAPIYSRDDRYLGKVKEAGRRCFLVDVRFAFDYWLSTRAVATVEDGRVLLGVDKRDVGNYLVDVDCLDDFDDLDPVTERTVALELVPAT